jgi:hypothetical protein
MEHARKLKLIDSNFDTRNVKKRYSQLDKSISEVLESDESVDEREKARRYQQALNRFLVNRETVERELERPVEVEVTALPEEEKKRAAPRELSHYSAGVSKKRRRRLRLRESGESQFVVAPDRYATRTVVLRRLHRAGRH